jgi:transposase
VKASGCEVELSKKPLHDQEAFMSHANAELTPPARLRLAQLVVERGWTYSAAAKMFMVTARTARKWAERYRTEGAAGMLDRSSRPHRMPSKTPPQVVRQIVRLRWRHRLGPVQIAGRLWHASLHRARGAGAVSD